VLVGGYGLRGDGGDGEIFDPRPRDAVDGLSSRDVVGLWTTVVLCDRQKNHRLLDLTRGYGPRFLNPVRRLRLGGHMFANNRDLEWLRIW